MNLDVTTFVNGRWKENCYIISNPAADAIMIDPGSQADELVSLVDKHRWQVLAIVNTHAHFDHIGAVSRIKEHCGAPFYLHGADLSLLKRANLFRMLFEARTPVTVPTVDQDLAALPNFFDVGPFTIEWIPTPGHTEGSVCLRFGNLLFSGDTLLPGTVGRTDLPGGNRERLLASVKMLGDLPPETVVYPGHGPQTTIAAEFAEGSPVRSILQ